MTIKVRCDQCGAAMKIKDELAGRTGNCPQCQTKFKIPTLEESEQATAADAESDSELAAATAKSKSSPRSTKAKPGFAEDDIDSILSGEIPTPTASAHRSHLAEEADTDANEDFQLTATDLPARSESKKGDTVPPTSAAEVARSFMKGDSGEITKEPKKKARRAFGEAPPRPAGESKSFAQNVKERGPKVLLIVLGGIFAAWGGYWLSTQAIVGQKYPPLGRVEGVITLDGKPLPGANVIFQPMLDPTNPDKDEERKKFAASVGVTDANGKYSLTYVDDVPGAAVGMHFIRVTAQDATGRELVPIKYNLQSSLQEDIKSGTNTIDLKLVIAD